MERRKKKTADVKGQRVLAIAILLIACVMIVVLTGSKNRLNEVVINRIPGNYVSVSDEEIIRTSGLKMGAQISSIAEMSKKVESGINSGGKVKFEQMTRVSGRCIEITVSAREPIAVINSAGSYVLIDKDGCVMDILMTLPTDNIVYVTGAEILTQEKGRTFATRKEAQLKAIIDIALAIRNGGYQSTYSELNVKDVKDILLITNTSQIIEIFDGSDIEKKLKIADEIIREGNTKGKISISGNYAGYLPPEGS